MSARPFERSSRTNAGGPMATLDARISTFVGSWRWQVIHTVNFTCAGRSSPRERGVPGTPYITVYEVGEKPSAVLVVAMRRYEGAPSSECARTPERSRNTLGSTRRSRGLTRPRCGADGLCTLSDPPLEPRDEIRPERWDRHRSSPGACRRTQLRECSTRPP
jgi:hypothetical protein